MKKRSVLLITPPMTQVNTPYPATAYLSGYLRANKIDVAQVDLSLELFLALYSRNGLKKIFSSLKTKSHKSELAGFFLHAENDYLSTIETLVSFLQGEDPSLALRIASRSFLPEGPRFAPLNEHDELTSHFGTMGTHDKAKYIASLYIDDINDLIKLEVDPLFEISRYGDSLASSQNSFNPIAERLSGPTSLIDQIYDDILKSTFNSYEFDILGVTCPFPGNVYGAFRAAKMIKKLKQNVTTVLGGGFVSTELRDLSDDRVFDFFDYLVFDDGELPLKKIVTLESDSKSTKLTSIRSRQIHTVTPTDNTSGDSFKERPAPYYADLKLNKYVSMLELPNPMHRLWSGYRWNKMILAHGCYWKKCTFCDTNLDYIARFEPNKASNIVDQIEEIISQTGTTGFHFVDEAAPPALLKQMSAELIKRNVKISWWGNLRFDSLFDEETCNLMFDSGCIAVTGGLEVASPRVLKLINKGLSVEQAVRVTHNLKRSGIHVHAYLMYGFPTQTAQETIDSLEVVRQMFQASCLDSGYWHRFLATVHSPVGRNPEKFGVKLSNVIVPNEGLFAKYSVPFSDPTEVNHDLLGNGLRRALYNYMHGIGLAEELSFWFETKIPKTKLKKSFVKNILKL